MIDLRSEPLLTLAQAARVQPGNRRGIQTHPSTVYRWIARGVCGHRLEAVRLGGSLFTSAEALQRFADKLTGGSTAPTPTLGRADRAITDEFERLGL